MKRSKHKTNIKGFTLIEVVIAMVIMATMLMFAAPSFSQWVQNSKIRNAADGIQTGLQLARAESIRRNTNVQFVLTSLAGGGTLSDWSVICATSSATCPGTGQAQTSIQSASSQEGAANAVVTSSVSSIAYNAMGRLTPAPANDISIDITNPAAGNCVPSGSVRCQRVVISVTGQVKRCDPALASGIPGSC